MGCEVDLFCLLQASEDNMSDLEKGMITIIQVFHKYSGHKCKLKKADLKAFIDNEMSNFITVRYGTKCKYLRVFDSTLQNNS